MTNNQTKPDYMYRQGVGMMVINKQDQIFVGKRIDNNSDAWQMPQGGIEAGEDEDLAMFRELKEETGIVQNLEIIHKSTNYFYYNLPYRLQKKFWGGKFLGQRQRWYLLRYLGEDDKININIEEPEFSDWKWVGKDQITEVIVSFKKELYTEILAEFNQFFIK